MGDEAAVRVHYDDLELDDQLALLNGAPLTGIVYPLYPDGSLEEEGLYSDGLPEGLQQRWYPGGAIEWRLIALRGRGASEDRSWYQNGRLRSLSRYVDQRRVEAQAWDEGPIDPATRPPDDAFGAPVEKWK